MKRADPPTKRPKSDDLVVVGFWDHPRSEQRAGLLAALEGGGLSGHEIETLLMPTEAAAPEGYYPDHERALIDLAVESLNSDLEAASQQFKTLLARYPDYKPTLTLTTELSDRKGAWYVFEFAGKALGWRSVDEGEIDGYDVEGVDGETLDAILPCLVDNAPDPEQVELVDCFVRLMAEHNERRLLSNSDHASRRTPFERARE